MKQIVFVSGKGGTGKTSVTAAVAALAPAKRVLADLDVDAANLSILFAGAPARTVPFMGQPKATVNASACTGCAQCLSVCAFNAVTVRDDVALVDTMTCEGCHACALVCPEDAISFAPHPAGAIHLQPVDGGTLVHAELGVAEDNSGKLVSEVRKLARAEADRLKADTIFLDGPPGIGCPVHAALNNVQLAVIVTEPSVSGISDFARILKLCGQFGIPAAVIINKSDLAPPFTEKILQQCMENNLPILGIIPFSRDVPLALSSGKTLLAVPAIEPIIVSIHQQLKSILADLALG